MPAVIDQYLSRYATAGVQAQAKRLHHGIHAVLTVPAFDEPFAALRKIIEHPDLQPRATIIVCNAPQSAQADAIARTQALVRQLAQHYALNNDGKWYVGETAPKQSLFICDLTAEDALLLPNEGVGRARKIGLDLALALAERSASVFNEPLDWLHSTDADATLPADYFGAASAEFAAGAVALVYPFRHRARPGLQCPMHLYQLRLDYYVAALRAAGSPYAFHTVGSTIAVKPLAYAQVRGIPARAAGEDFYLLNKVAKLGVIATPASAPIELAGRKSDRVPFGTGPALAQIAQLAAPRDDYRYYAPACFMALKCLLSAVHSASEHDGHASYEQALAASLEQQGQAHPGVDVALIHAGLKQLGIPRFYAHLVKQGSHRSESLFHDWFDGFRTLKFVHYLRDHAYPSITLAELAATGAGAEFLPPTLAAHIAALEEHTLNDPA